MLLRRPVLSAAILGLLIQLTVSVPAAHAAPVVPPDHPTISADSFNSFVVTDGSVRGAGSNSIGQLGALADPTTTLSPVPTLAAGVTATSIDSTNARVLAVGDNGRVYGVGFNDTGQLTGTADSYSSFHELTGLPPGEQAVEVNLTQRCTLVLTESGKLYRAGQGSELAPGFGFYGQCPKGPAELDNELTLVPGIPVGRTVEAFGLGGNFETLVVALDDGSLLGSGYDNADDRLPGPTAGPVASLQPLTALPGGVDAKDVSVGSTHVLVLDENGVVHGAGNTTSSELTDAPLVAGWRTFVMPVPAVQVAGSTAGSAVLGNDGNLYATGNITQFHPTIANVTSLTLMPTVGVGEITEMDGRNINFLVRGTDGFVWGTGENATGNLTGAPTPSPQSGFTRLTGQVNRLVIAPTFTGTLKYGSTLTAVDGTWQYGSPSVTRKWLRNAVPIPGATGPTYTLQKADAGKQIAVVDTVSTEFYTDSIAISTAQGVAAQLFNVKRPTITGKAKKGKTLSISSKGTWTPSPTKYTYRWLRNGKAISGASGKTYKLKKADNNKKITVRITVTRAGYIGAVAISSNYKKY